MADPTLKDVLAALAKLDAKVERLDGKVEGMHADMTKRFDDLDSELTTHAKVHKELEKDVTALKGRPARTAARAPRRR